MKCSINLFLICAFLSGCNTLKTDSEVRLQTENEIKPVHITIDLNVRIQREIDNFFDDIDDTSSTMNADSKTQ